MAIAPFSFLNRQASLKPRFVVLGYTSGGTPYTFYSDDLGQNWAAGSLPLAGTWRKVAYGNGVWIAVGQNLIGRSADGGKTFTNISVNGNWTDVCYMENVGRWVIMSGTVANTATRTSDDDGATWTARTISSRIWSNIVYGNGWAVAVAQNTSGNNIGVTQDGINWSYLSKNPGDTWHTVGYVEDGASGSFIAGTLSSTAGRRAFEVDKSSPDTAAAWTAISIAAQYKTRASGRHGSYWFPTWNNNNDFFVRDALGYSTVSTPQKSTWNEAATYRHPTDKTKDVTVVVSQTGTGRICYKQGYDTLSGFTLISSGATTGKTLMGVAIGYY